MGKQTPLPDQRSFQVTLQRGLVIGKGVIVAVFANNLSHTSMVFKSVSGGFPGGTVVKNPPANAGDTGSSPGPGRSHMLWSN